MRHAEVEAPYQGIFGGTIDMSLSPRGHQQAVVLANYLRAKPFHALYASPMKRVQQTLAPLLQNSAPQPRIFPELREIDFGDWTGLSWDDIQVKFGVSAFTWLDQLERDAVPNGESAAALKSRIEPRLREILLQHPGREVSVWCHGGVIRMVLALLLGWPLSRMSAFQFEYASVTRVALLAHKTELQLVNFTPWRDFEP